MFIGHYAAGFAGARSPRIKLWQAFIAVQFIDFIWAAFIVLGIEHMRIIPEFTAVNPLDLHHMPYSHSLLFCAVWAVIGAAGFKLMTRQRGWTGALIFGALVLSHWATDLIVHVPDLPLWPGSAKYGFGLWDNLYGALAAELGLLALGIVIYFWRRGLPARAVIWIGALAIFMIGLHLVNMFGGVPHSVIFIAAGGLLTFSLLAWLAAMAERRALAD